MKRIMTAMAGVVALGAPSKALAEVRCGEVETMFQAGVSPSVIHFLLEESDADSSSTACLASSMVDAINFYDTNSYGTDLSSSIEDDLFGVIALTGDFVGQELAVMIIDEKLVETSSFLPSVLVLNLFLGCQGCEEKPVCNENWQKKNQTCHLPNGDVDYLYVANMPNPCRMTSASSRCGSPDVDTGDDPPTTEGE